MNIAAIGVGGAGGQIVDRLARELGTGAGSPLETVHAIDTDTASLDTLGSVPGANRHIVGQFETGGDGADGDRELASEIVENERTEIRRAVEDGVPTTIDAIVVTAGLAGGTGSAVTPALTAGLANVYEQPVYAVSVLPSERNTDEQRRANTAHGLTGLEESATAQIVFDNDAWIYGSRSLESHGDRINGVLTDRLGELFTLGQEHSGAVGEQVIDTRDTMGTLDGGKLVSLGYASRDIAAWRGADSSLLDGLKRRVFGDDTESYERGRATQRTLAWATRGTMTFECPRGAATHGLVAFRGPPGWLRGDAISRGREWLADRADIERLRSGDIPVEKASSLDVFVVLAGIEGTPRIDEFRQNTAADDGTTGNGTEVSEQSDSVTGDGNVEETAEDDAESTTEVSGSAESDAETETEPSSKAQSGDAEPESGPEDGGETTAESDEQENWGVPPGESGDADSTTAEIGEESTADETESTADDATAKSERTDEQSDGVDEADADASADEGEAGKNTDSANPDESADEADVSVDEADTVETEESPDDEDSATEESSSEGATNSEEAESRNATKDEY